MKKKILLVDDKATIGKVAGIYLGKDYDFTYLEDPFKAIQSTRTQNSNQKDYRLTPDPLYAIFCLHRQR